MSAENVRHRFAPVTPEKPMNADVSESNSHSIDQANHESLSYNSINRIMNNDKSEESISTSKAKNGSSPSKNGISSKGSSIISPKSKYYNWWVRLASTIGILAVAMTILKCGPTAVVLLVLFIQLNAFNEIISIGYRIYKLYELPRFRTLSWYFLVCINYWFYGELIQDHLKNLALFQRESPILAFILGNHRFITYLMFVFGFCGYVLSLQKGYYAKQFFFFGWTIVSLLAVVFQSHFFISNVMNGLVWIVLPQALVVVNDSMAYICGFFWPWKKNPLILLSPKKTWEGFIGGALFTCIACWFLSAHLAQNPYYICPVEVTDNFIFSVVPEDRCEIDNIYKVQEILKVPTVFGSDFLKNLLNREVIKMRWFQVHSCMIALFASILGPFGGFFASGLKRGFKIKDFGDSIPGHGGFLDRFDCHYMVGTFTWVYIASFIKIPNLKRITNLATRMDVESQKALLFGLFKSLKDQFTPEEMQEMMQALL